MHYHKKNAGFTLIELIVVISLLAILLAFAIPRLPGSLFKEDSNETARWLILKVKLLKEKALHDKVLYFLNLDVDNGIMWISDQSMDEDEEAKENARKEGHALSNDLRITGVEFPEPREYPMGEAKIRFFKNGYSDKAIINMEDEDNQYSFIIEPFLSKVRMYDTYKSFNN